MKVNYILFFFLAVFILPVALSAQMQAPAILWQKTIGGSDTDILSSMYALNGGGVALSGYSSSGISGDKKEASRGAFDFWAMKLNANGDIAWEKTYGGQFDDTATRIIRTTDNGFLLGGTSLSDRSGDKGYLTNGLSPDYWVLKLDKNGQLLWQKNFGGDFTEKLMALSENSYGYALTGHSYSDISGDKTTDNTGSENRADYWLVSTDKTGKLKHTYTYGTVGPELACCSISSDYGNIVGGSSYSRAQQGAKTHDPYGGCDYWIVRTDLSGTKQYDSTIGGSSSDFMTCLIGAHDGGYVAGGYSESPVSGLKTEPCRGAYDYWVLKMNIDGHIIWQKTLGGSLGDYMTSVAQTRDGGFLVGGYSNSDISGEKSENSKGGYDYWIVKLDSSGNKQWDKTFGGSGDDMLTGVAELDSGQYIMAGTSNSPVSGDKTSGTVGGTGDPDFWVIRLGPASVDSGGGTGPTDPTDPNHPDTTKGKYVLNILSNPTHNTLNIQFSSTDDAMTNFVLHSYDGKKVLTFSKMATTDMSQPTSIPIGKLQSGVYYLTMYTKNQKVTKMVVKQ